MKKLVKDLIKFVIIGFALFMLGKLAGADNATAILTGVGVLGVMAAAVVGAVAFGGALEWAFRE